MKPAQTLTKAVCDGKRDASDYLRLGWYFNRIVERWRTQTSVYAAAKRLRRQGVPLQVALVLLLDKRKEHRNDQCESVPQLGVHLSTRTGKAYRLRDRPSTNK